MTNPTLEDWHALYTAFREKFPEGPRLLETDNERLVWLEYSDFQSVRIGVRWKDSTASHGQAVMLPAETSKYVMLDWAMRAGAWWQDQHGARYFDVVMHTSDRWSWSTEAEKRFNKKSGDAGTHHAAYYAAIEAITDRG